MSGRDWPLCEEAECLLRREDYESIFAVGEAYGQGRTIASVLSEQVTSRLYERRSRA